MKKLEKENNKNKSGFAENEVAAGSKEAINILNSKVAIPIDILERNKKFDSNYNEMNYNIKLKELRRTVYEFSSSYFDQILTLAAGGHDCALKIVEPDFLIEILEKGCKHNQLLSRLRGFYYELNGFQEELRCIIGEQNEYITKREFEVFMR
jgi:hypothetical protein